MPNLGERKLIPYSQTIVVLDTDAVRQLVHEPSVTWDETFAQMASDGYSFSLGDIPAFELVAAFQRGAITSAERKELIERLSRFLNPHLRVLAAWTDTVAMVDPRKSPVDVKETAFLSSEAWRYLCADFDSDHYVGPSSAHLVEEEKVDWISFLDGINEHIAYSGLDISKMHPDQAADLLAVLAASSDEDDCHIYPEWSVRSHLETRYRFRQALRKALKKGAYNPLSTSRKNDSADLAMYSYLGLPAFVLSLDSGFFSKLEGIESFQRGWFMRPSELAEKWKGGARPKPEWPSQTWIDEHRERSILDFLVSKS